MRIRLCLRAAHGFVSIIHIFFAAARFISTFRFVSMAFRLRVCNLRPLVCVCVCELAVRLNQIGVKNYAFITLFKIRFFFLSLRYRHQKRANL